MKLTDDQKAAVMGWAEEDGVSLGEIQKRLSSELGISVTYLETRFLLDDHGIELKAASEPEADGGAAQSDDDDLDAIEAILDDDEQSDDVPGGGGLVGEDGKPVGGGSGKVTVTVDTVAQPHAMVSGKVTFSDGTDAGWYLDQLGRLGIDPSNPDHRPSEEDLMAFQQELQKVMGRM